MNANSISEHTSVHLQEFLDSHILIGWTPSGEFVMNARIEDERTAHHLQLFLVHLLQSRAIAGMVPGKQDQDQDEEGEE